MVTKNKKKSRKKLWLWIFSIIFIIGGIGRLSDSFLAGIFALAAGVIICPPIIKIIKEKSEGEAKNWMFVTAFIVLVLSSGMALSGSNRSQSSEDYGIEDDASGMAEEVVTEETTPDETITEEETPSDQDSNNIYNIGESFILSDSSGGVLYRVDSVQNADVLEGWILTQEPLGIYYIVTITAENKGSKPREYFIPRVTIVDDKGREFSEDRDSRGYLGEYGKRFFSDQLQPGLSRQGVIAFDLPLDATGLKIKIRQGTFFAEEAFVELI